MARGIVRHRGRVPLDGRGDRVRCDGLSADGARDPALASKRSTRSWRPRRDTLGARRLRVFLTITLPLALPGVITGMLLSFARSLGEFGATITFVSNIPGETQHAAARDLYLHAGPGGDAQALRLSMISVVLSLAALLVVGNPGAARHAARAKARMLQDRR